MVRWNKSEKSYQLNDSTVCISKGMLDDMTVYQMGGKVLIPLQYVQELIDKMNAFKLFKDNTTKICARIANSHDFCACAFSEGFKKRLTVDLEERR